MGLVLLEEEKENEFQVKSIVEFLRKTSMAPSPAQLTLTKPVTDWILFKAVDNKKEDIMWRLFHKALPLEEIPTTPNSIDEVFTAFNFTKEVHYKNPIWIHINPIYEIWCWNTTTKWGSSSYPEVSLSHIVKNHISKEIQ
ncbi:20281_t:CDS:2, partial [Gigaspora rosea]